MIYETRVNSQGCHTDKMAETLEEVFDRTTFPTLRRPPLGLKPKWLHDEQRLDEIKDAINRYTEKGEPIPQEWIEEYNSLIKTDKRYDRRK